MGTVALKESWQMTQAEAWRKEPKIAIGRHGADRPGVKWVNWHKTQVNQALSEGKPVPSEVLADYPDLMAEAGKKRFMELPDDNGFFRKWNNAKKTIPPERMGDAYAYLTGSIAGYVPAKAIDEIISGVLDFVKK